MLLLISTVCQKISEMRVRILEKSLCTIEIIHLSECYFNIKVSINASDYFCAMLWTLTTKEVTMLRDHHACCESVINAQFGSSNVTVLTEHCLAEYGQM